MGAALAGPHGPINMRLSFPHPYWYEVGMLKVPASIQYRPAYKKPCFGLRLRTLSRATAGGVCHKKFKHTNEVFAANEPNSLGPISNGTQQVSNGIHSYERTCIHYIFYIKSAYPKITFNSMFTRLGTDYEIRN